MDPHHEVTTMARLSLLLALAVAASALAAPVTLIDNGQPRAVIVTAANDPKAETAAKALQTYLAQMSGTTLPIVKEGDALPAGLTARVLVGHTDAAKRLGVKIPAGFDPSIRPAAFSEEGYVLRTRGRDVVVGGNADGPYYGTVFAAYALLERLGCRWYFPGEWGEVIPEQKTVIVPDLNVTARPDFAVRGIWLSGWVPITAAERAAYTEWSARVGFSSGNPNGQFYPIPGDGYLGCLLPPKEYKATHMEYYAMNKQGVREVAARDLERLTMLCLSNPDVLAESISNIKKAFAGEKRLACVFPNGVGISPPDGAPYCYCDRCLAQSQHFDYPTYTHEKMQSEEFFGFAARLADTFPDKWIATAGYALREMPPQGVTLPPNIQVMYAPISSCVLHPGNDPRCWRRQETMQLLKNWSKQTKHITIYDYNPGLLCGYFVPECDVANFTVNARLYQQLGIKGFQTEGRKSFMNTWISYYIRAKLMWDVQADVAALKQDFYTTFFGPEAGPHVRAWWDACEAELAKSTAHVHEDWLLSHIYTVDFTNRLHAFVEAAQRAGGTARQRANVATFALIADHLEADAAMEDAERRLDFAAAAAAAGRMQEDKVKLQAISPWLITVEQRATPRPYFSDGRQLALHKLAARTDGTTGTLVAPLPLEMKFARDRFNEGVIAEWYDPQFDDRAWGTKNTFFTWEAQDAPEDAAGHDYDGYGWYRGTFDVPAGGAGGPLRLWLGGLINEGWVWINGEYVGHKPFLVWWMHQHEFDADVSKQVRPGRNTIAIRVWNNADVGGMYRRGFLYAPKEAAQ